MRKPTSFGIAVKTKLMTMGQTQEWLCSEVKNTTGLFVDSSYMAKILNGQRSAPKVRGAIKDILDLPDEGGDNE